MMDLKLGGLEKSLKVGILELRKWRENAFSFTLGTDL